MKEELQTCMSEDLLIWSKIAIIARKILTENSIEAMDKDQKECCLAAMKYAEESPLAQIRSLLSKKTYSHLPKME